MKNDFSSLRVYYDFDGTIIKTSSLDDSVDGDYNFIEIDAEEHEKWFNDYYKAKIVVDGKLTDIKPNIFYLKQQKLYEITNKHLQANLAPATKHSAYLLDDQGNKTEEIVNFCFDIKKTESMVCDPLSILMSTIALQNAGYSFTEYYCNKIIDNKITDEKICICLDKELAINILTHLRERTQKDIKLVRKYKIMVAEANTVDDINNINPIFD
mgnify:CR=1 FL=1